MKKSQVEGLNGPWGFGFKKLVKHGLGEREVQVVVPVIQVLELADQFRACGGGPAHAIWHLQHSHRPVTCDHSQALETYYYCRGCKSGCRNTDQMPEGGCPTCNSESLIELPKGVGNVDPKQVDPVAVSKAYETSSQITAYMNGRIAAGDPEAVTAREVFMNMLHDLSGDDPEDKEAVREVLALVQCAFQAGRATAKPPAESLQ